MTHTEKQKNGKFRNSITLKLIIITSISLLLLIPSFMVRKLISEREYRSKDTMREITKKWGGEQVIYGPILVVPYERKNRYYNNSIKSELSYFQILPNKVTINGSLETDLRHRGIYEVLIYSGDFTIAGDFDYSSFNDWPEKYNKIHWEDAKLVLGISDTKGIAKIASLEWNEANKKFSPGNSHTKLFSSGIHSGVDVSKEKLNTFNIKLALNGSRSCYFASLGNQTEVFLKADWNTPKFDGDCITANNEISDSSFTAEWLTNEMSRNLPQIISDENYVNVNDIQTFGVKLMLPVDTYQKSERSVKYSFLFIVLTFFIIFFSEITGKTRVHPVQYSIAGLALVIFYSLLISLAEHMSFNAAYMLASLVITLLITFYGHTLFKSAKNALIIGGSIVILYSFLFTVLQIADYALLLGNIGLVVILGVVMLFSRKIDWYGGEKKMVSK